MMFSKMHILYYSSISVRNLLGLLVRLAEVGCVSGHQDEY